MSLDRYWYAPMPAARVAVLRVLLGLYGLGVVAVRGHGAWVLAGADPRLFAPIGVLAHLTRPLDAAWIQGLIVLTLLANAAFLLGWRYRVAGPLYAGLLLVLLTWTNSWGQIQHTDHLFALYVLILAAAPAADTFSLDARGGARRGAPSLEPDGRYGWPVRLMCWVAVLAYVLAGVAKLRYSGLAFLDGDVLRIQVAFDNARKLELGSVASPLAPAVLGLPGLFAVLALATLVLELGAPLALLHRRAAAVWAVGMWGFQVGVLVLMAIVFPFQLSFLAFAPFFPVERLGAFVPAAVSPPGADSPGSTP